MIPLQEKLQEDLKKAMRRGDVLRRSVLRLLRADIHNEEIAQQKTLDDEGVLRVINRQVRQHRESIEQFRLGRRMDLVEQEEAELQILQEYLPPQLSREDLVELARRAIQETSAQDPRDKGRVMRHLMPQVHGRAEGAEVNAVVTELLEKLQ